MSTEYVDDIKKYTANVNDTAVKSIVKFCGIALRNRDSALVSITDAEEVARVVKGFASKRLGLDSATAEAGIKAVGEKMKADRTKHRVTVYYLLAEHTGTLAKLA